MKTLIKNVSVLLPDGKVKEADIAVDGAKMILDRIKDDKSGTKFILEYSPEASFHLNFQVSSTPYVDLLESRPAESQWNKNRTKFPASH